MGFFDLFKGDKKTIESRPLLTPEQQEAMNLLLLFGKTGRTPSGFSLGAPIDTSGFSDQPTLLENLGKAGLGGLATSGERKGLSTARDTLTKLATEEFSPDDPSSTFGSFKRLLARETADASDVLDREAARTGSRLSTNIGRQKRELGDRTTDVIANQLARLFDSSKNRSLRASLGLGNIESLAENMEMGRLAGLFRFGDLDRQLQNKKAAIDYSERQRQQDEKLLSLTGLERVFNRHVPYGVTEQEIESPSLFSRIAQPLFKVATSIPSGGLGSLFT